MPRQARVVAAGVPHHVTQRGNNRQNIFLQDQDRFLYLDLLRTYSLRYEMQVLGYCLMTNHVHLVVVPAHNTSMALALGNAHRVYAQRFNSTYGRSGHLWQNRFFSTALGRSETLVALAYGDLNPVRAGLVGQAEQWPWSSAQAHVDGQDRTGTIDWQACRRYCDLDNWATVLATDGYRAEGILLRRAAAAGMPYADEALTTELEEREGRPLRPKHRTRSKRRVAAASI